jgi:hypothetical protein
MILFSTTASVNLAQMLAVPQKNRPFSMAVGVLGIHAFGDVPSPIIIGYIKDYLAPNCALSSASTCSADDSYSDDDHVPPVVDTFAPTPAPTVACEEDGLRHTLLYCTSWLAWSLLFYSIAYSIACQRYKQHYAQNNGTLSEALLNQNKRTAQEEEEEKGEASLSSYGGGGTSIN